MTLVSWKGILWGSVNMNSLNWWEIDWAGIDYQTFFTILVYCYRDTNNRDITTLLSKNYKSLRDFVKDQEAWSMKNKNQEHTKAVSIVKRYLRNKSVNKEAQRSTKKHKEAQRTCSCISFC